MVGGCSGAGRRRESGSGPIDKLGSVFRRPQRSPRLEVQAMPDQAPEVQAREFAAAFRGFLDWVHLTAAREDNEVSALVHDSSGPVPFIIR